VYLSPSLNAFGDPSHQIRIASKLTGESDQYQYATECGEVVLRQKPAARTSLRAKFLEATGKVYILTLQRFDEISGQPYGNGFTFTGEEIPRLLEFLTQLRNLAFEDGRSLNLTEEELRSRVLTTAQATALLEGNEELFAEVVRNALSKEDVVAQAYRRQELGVFERLLTDPEYFAEAKGQAKCGEEALWQRFFEKNPWIFGYGLRYLYGTSLDDAKLEQTVHGHSVFSPGKRVDALLKSKAIASTLCFLEIKRHTTELLAKTAYRSGCYTPSSELIGAVAQVQATVSHAAQTLFGQRSVASNDGFPTGEEVFNFAPRSFVVVGSLGEFRNDHGISEDRLRAFELYRTNLHQPEIYTFDEIFERARHIVHTADVD
jgi:hypothetical protein